MSPFPKAYYSDENSPLRQDLWDEKVEELYELRAEVKAAYDRGDNKAGDKASELLILLEKHINRSRT